MNQKIKHLLLLIAFFVTFQCVAQDLHFSQYFNNPLFVNPANTGFNPDYDFRVGGNYRSQWANVGAPYNTMSAWADTKLMQNRFENGWLGLGGTLLKDVAGSGNLTSTSVNMSIAYHQMLGYNSLLSGGFSLGYVEKRVDITKLSFDDQWNGSFFDIKAPSNEPFSSSKVGFLDLRMGLNYAYFLSDNIYINAGVSIMHINRPQESFFSSLNIDNRIERRYTAFANASIKIQNLWIVNPNIYVSKMGGSWETVIGLNANRNLSGDGYQQLIVGLYYRAHDALIPMFGYQVNDLKVTVNYDATISTLGNLNGSRGAYELSIVKSGVFTNSSNTIKCPTVKF